MNTQTYRWNGRQTDSYGWSRNAEGKAIEPLRGSRKVGGNKGVMAARRAERRRDAEERNTCPHRATAPIMSCGHNHYDPAFAHGKRGIWAAAAVTS